MVLILLPPSEGKRSPDTTAHLDLRALSFPGLTSQRRGTLRALEALCRDQDAARSALGLGPTQRDEITQNRRLRRSPVDAAVRVYTGVVYEALDPASLTGDQLRRLDETVAIGSALWGLVRPLDPIPAYRLSAGSRLPGVDASAWRAPVGALLADADGPVLDLRSGAYQSLAPVPRTPDAVVCRILLERDGRRTVVSHHNKATKGRLVRAVVRSDRPVRSVDELAQVAEQAGLQVEVHGSRSGPGRLDLIATSL